MVTSAISQAGLEDGLAKKLDTISSGRLVFHEQYCDGTYGACYDQYRDAGVINTAVQEKGPYYVVTDSSGQARCEIRKSMVAAMGMDTTQFQTLLSLPFLEMQCGVWGGGSKIKDFFEYRSDSIDVKSEIPYIQPEPTNEVRFGLNIGPIQTDYGCGVPGVGCGNVITFGPRKTFSGVLYTMATLNVTGKSKALSAYINIGLNTIDVKTLNKAGWTVLEVLNKLSQGISLSCGDDQCSNIVEGTN